VFRGWCRLALFLDLSRTQTDEDREAHRPDSRSRQIPSSPTHPSTSRAHLGKYLGEFAGVSSTGDVSATERIELMADRMVMEVSSY